MIEPNSESRNKNWKHSTRFLDGRANLWWMALEGKLSPKHDARDPTFVRISYLALNWFSVGHCRENQDNIHTTTNIETSPRKLFQFPDSDRISRKTRVNSSEGQILVHLTEAKRKSRDIRSCDSRHSFPYLPSSLHLWDCLAHRASFARWKDRYTWFILTKNQ